MIDMYPFRNAVTVSHMMTEPYARQAHVLVDMTCGNGHDTQFLMTPSSTPSISSPVPSSARASACRTKAWGTRTSAAAAGPMNNCWLMYSQTLTLSYLI